jgi:hypothetical protein
MLSPSLEVVLVQRHDDVGARIVPPALGSTMAAWRRQHGRSAAAPRMQFGVQCRWWWIAGTGGEDSDATVGVSILRPGP